MSKTLPVPEDLKVKTILGMIICSVKPLSFFKYLVAGVKGYEFYGSYNSTFKPEADDYIQTGTHCGTDSSDFLWTNMSSEADPAATGTTFVFDPRVVRVLAANQLTLENLTQGTSGTLSFTPMSYMTAYKLRVVDSVNGGFLQWDTNDRWRIKEYPANRLLSIGPWAMFIKTFKTIFLDFYVKARTVGRGNSFSEFATGDTTTGDETMPAPTNLTATQRKRLVQIFTGSDVYWVQDIPYVDILLEWDDLPNEYGPMSYEISEKTPGV